ncbi:CapA family protein [Saccharomonospora azurea]|uniref:CapA family protein n=1 Tax=Saccharomonospora azurea TaxID=40988 RepID=UPI00023FF91E|nr:CapA family protein [Saccharomonospora azurea]EHK87720.1 poly-gamma-glutamate synthesis protein [Saccharomonospora azurea SZMC 14600]
MAAVTLFLAGDVMPGRGIDQVLPYPGDHRLREPVPFSWPWGSALQAIEHEAPTARIINLETSVTRARAFAAGKSVHYRMRPENVPAVLAAKPDVCVLANNHVLDFGRQGLVETLAVLTRAGLGTVGAGHDAAEAARPAVVPSGVGRVVVLAAAATSSGVPVEWAAGPHSAGVRLLDLAVHDLKEQVTAAKRAGNLVVVSLHWGSNWGYGVGSRQVALAHRLVDAGADVVHGHSSHHPRPIEVYRGRLVLYGCGDLVNDYEGISGFERYRGDLRLLYFPSLDPRTGALLGMRMVPLQARRLRLQRAGSRDQDWLRSVLSRCSAPFGTKVESGDGVLWLTWHNSIG